MAPDPRNAAPVFKTITLRVSDYTLARAEGLVPKVRRLHGNSPATSRADVLRVALERGMDSLTELDLD